jgi:hypothetical protein
MTLPHLPMYFSHHRVIGSGPIIIGQVTEFASFCLSEVRQQSYKSVTFCYKNNILYYYYQVFFTIYGKDFTKILPSKYFQNIG